MIIWFSEDVGVLNRSAIRRKKAVEKRSEDAALGDAGAQDDGGGGVKT